ncbi:hypothetical protein Droror1_Dr00018978 [Drosera rotundifolia]
MCGRGQSWCVWARDGPMDQFHHAPALSSSFSNSSFSSLPQTRRREGERSVAEGSDGLDGVVVVGVGMCGGSWGVGWSIPMMVSTTALETERLVGEGDLGAWHLVRFL